MSRARGANAKLALAIESVFNTPPASGYFYMPFVSHSLGDEQQLIDSDLLGQGRDMDDPSLDVITNTGDIVVPIDARNLGIWLYLLFGAANSAAGQDAADGDITFSAQPTATTGTITINGVVFTFIAGASSGTNVQIKTSLTLTLDELVTVLNASANASVTPATYSKGGSTKLLIVYDTPGTAGNAFTLAASVASNGVVSGSTLANGTKLHQFYSGAQNLPSASVEIQHPEIPAYNMHRGLRTGSLRVRMQRSGLLTGTIACIAKGEDGDDATNAGSPSEYDVIRFAQFRGSVKRDGVQIGSIVSAEFTFSNSLETVDTIATDGEIEDSDPGLVMMSGTIAVRYANNDLRDAAEDHIPCSLEFKWTAIGTPHTFNMTAHRVFLPRTKVPITGQGGIEASYQWKASREDSLGTPRSVTASLTTDVASFP